MSPVLVCGQGKKTATIRGNYMKKIYLNAGDTLYLNLDIKLSASRTLSYEEEDFKYFLEHAVRKFLSDPDFVSFDEVSKL